MLLVFPLLLIYIGSIKILIHNHLGIQNQSCHNGLRSPLCTRMPAVKDPVTLCSWGLVTQGSLTCGP